MIFIYIIFLIVSIFLLVLLVLCLTVVSGEEGEREFILRVSREFIYSLLALSFCPPPPLY